MTDAPVYGTRTLKRERRTCAQVEQLDQQIIEVLIDDHRSGATGALTLWCDVACAAVRDLAPESTQRGLGI
jgi:hypothetical protein